MNDFLRFRRNCQLGVKAYQNIRVSLLAFERLCTLIDSDDSLLLSSIFHMGVIRYAKPFLNAEAGTGVVRYPIKWLKKTSGFSMNVHEHLIMVRNTLIAHDDFDQIEPRLLTFGFTPEGSTNHILTSIVVGNKCIAYPADLDSTRKIQHHIAVALSSVQQKLFDDLGGLRFVRMTHPDQARQAERYSQHYGTQEIPAGGTRLTQPDFMNDKWLDVEEPDFSAIHNGFRYEGIRIRRDFYGPEKFQMPNGDEFEIMP